MKTRRDLLLGLGATLFTLPLDVLAQPKDRVWRIGILSSMGRTAASNFEPYRALPARLLELGYVEGGNLVFEWRFNEGDYERLPVLARELIRLPVDVIVTDGTPPTIAAKKETKVLPIVFLGAGDPVGDGLVRSLARPGGNTTGISNLLTDISGKQIELLGALVPSMSRVAIVYNSGNLSNLSIVKSLEAAATSRRMHVVPVGVRTEQDIDRAFSGMTRERVDSLVLVRDMFLSSRRRQVWDLALKARLPGMGGGPPHSEAGALLSYGQNMAYVYRRAADYVDKIFKGANPGDIPVEQPTKLELVINRKTAKALGLTIPPELLLLADRVIE